MKASNVLPSSPELRAGLVPPSPHALAQQGRLVVLVARQADKLQEVASAITAQGGKAVVRPCDLSDSKAVEALIEGVVDEYKRLDILVNNAGIT
ncbi:MAG: SDR family NAD(P)-dependent oxidoreductase, partial [Phycisphaerales bacterium]|nr:SDR family NAD(P)-dependent oxidoreductase [Phycisphaerales bacterium]